MNMIPVHSSAILAIGYDPSTSRMKIQFQEGHTYDFCRVPENIFKSFLAARSIGQYYNTYIRDKYQCP